MRMAGYLPPVSLATPAKPRDLAPSAAALRATFDGPGAALIGIEEELMLLDHETHALLPRVAEVLDSGPDDPRFRPELPAAQVEIVLPPVARVDEAAAALAAARRDLAARAATAGLLAAAGTHPFAPAEGSLNQGPAYAEMERDFGSIARRQLVFGLHVHVRVGGADRTIAVHDALRSYLPELAALAANAPFHDGEDSGMASVRPTLSGLLPRQGVPPALRSVEAFAADLAWGTRSGRLAGPHRWWWELRPHPTHGTLEVRVCDAQATVADTRAVAAVVRALVHELARRYDDGETLPVAETWRIAENRWVAARDGLAGTLVDLETGEPAPARRRLQSLLDELGPTAEALGDGEALATAESLVADGGGAGRQRAAADGDPRRAARDLAERFAAEL
jgi:carboxylate-amine ligase